MRQTPTVDAGMPPIRLVFASGGGGGGRCGGGASGRTLLSPKMSVGMWVIQLTDSKVFVTAVTLFTLLHKDEKR